MKYAASHSKIRRAVTHVAELETIFLKFLQSNFCSLDLKYDTANASNSLGVRVKALPVEVPVIIGETIYCLRSSLDLLASETVREAGLNANDTYFPIRQTLADVNGALLKSMIETAAPEIAQVIRTEIRPFPSGNATLCGMNKLGNLDKHRLLIPSVAVTEIADFVAEDPVNNNKVAIKKVVLNGGGRFGLIRSDNPMRIRDHGPVTAEIFFGPETEYEGKPVIPVLREFIDITRDAVAKIESVAKART